jgi:hypothetical protein
MKTYKVIEHPDTGQALQVLKTYATNIIEKPIPCTGFEIGEEVSEDEINHPVYQFWHPILSDWLVEKEGLTGHNHSKKYSLKTRIIATRKTVEQEDNLPYATHTPSPTYTEDEVIAIRLKNLSISRQVWLNIKNNLVHSNHIIANTLFAPEDEIEADYFHSKETNIKKYNSNAANRVIEFLKEGYNITFLDGSETKIRMFSPPLFDKYYSR